MEKLLFLSLDLPLRSVLGYVGGLLFLYMSLWSLAAITKKRADLADIAWGPGFMLVAWASLLLGQITAFGLIVNILVTVWAVRLALHLYFRNRNRDEDFRYQALKQKWKKNLRFNIFSNVFLLQGFLLYLIALPIVWIHTHPQELSLNILGIALPLWLVGFAFETIADQQMALFKKNPSNQGKLLTSGLWSFVRHPNYLGELLQWWAIWLMAAPLPFGWILVISPLLLTFLIVNISGIRALEEKLQKHPGFQKYLENTPSLIPPSAANGVLYTAAWFVITIYGAQNSQLIPMMSAAGCYIAQLVLYAKCNPAHFRASILLSIFAAGLGLLQEMVLIHFKILAYPNNGIFPPLWLLALYPLFSLTINFSLAFLNKRPLLSFFLGGFGGLAAYISGEKLGAVHIFPPFAYPALFLFWGVFLTVLLFLNRKLIAPSPHI